MIVEVFGKRFRLVDLSKKLVPGECYGPIGDRRRLEIERFHFPPGEIMHYVNLETHIGTHVEVPSHYVDARYGRHGKDLSEVPLETFIGEAVFIDLSSMKPGQPITPEMLEEAGVREGDIVIMGNGPYRGKELSKRNYIPAETAKWLFERRIKLLGVDDSVLVEDPKVVGKSLELYATHDFLLTNDIPFIESMDNLDKLRKKRFLFIAFPVSIARLDAFPLRAVALEEVE